MNSSILELKLRLIYHTLNELRTELDQRRGSVEHFYVCRFSHFKTSVSKKKYLSLGRCIILMHGVISRPYDKTKPVSSFSS